MANYANLLATIAANIYTNGNNEVTAAMVKTAVDAMVASLGTGYQFMGVATPKTTPPTSPDYPCFYIASEPGTYTDFPDSNSDPLEVYDGEVAIFQWDTSWKKVPSGAISSDPVEFQKGTIDDAVLNMGTTNTSYIWFQVFPNAAHIDKIRYRAYTGTTYFYKVDTRTNPATITLIETIVCSAADNDTIKEFAVDIDLEEREYIGFNGTIRYNSAAGGGYIGGHCDSDGSNIVTSSSGFACGFEVVTSIKYEIEKLLRSGSGNMVYTLDASGNGDFTNIYDALKDTIGKDSASNPLVFLVRPGTYVTPTLLPSEFFSYCQNRYIAIVGMDKVNCILRNDEGYYNGAVSDPGNLGDNSVIKVSGNVYIANLTIIATDDNNEAEADALYHQSYCLHIDTAAAEGSIIEIHNCRLINDHAPCIGFGLPKKCTLKVTDSELEADLYNPDNVFGGAVIYGHDKGGSTSVIEEHLFIKNCTFISSNGHAVKTYNNESALMGCVFVGNACALPSGKGIALGSTTSVVPPSFGNSVAGMNA